MSERGNLMGMPLDGGVKAESVVTTLLSKPVLLGYLNPYAWRIAKRDPSYPEVLAQLDLVTCDGVAARHAVRKLLGFNPEIISMDYSGIAPMYLDQASQRGLRLCLVGTTHDSLKAARRRIEADYPGIEVAADFEGYGNGPSQAADFIAVNQPELVLAGLGMGLQERFLLSLRDRGWQGSGVCVGAFFDRLANPRYDYPDWSRRRNLRFLGNLVRRPAYYMKRYGLDYWPFYQQYLSHRLRRPEKSS